MKVMGQKGFASILFLLLLIIGVGVGVMLVSSDKPIFFLSHADESTVEIVNSQGNPVQEITSPAIHVKVYPPRWNSISADPSDTPKSQSAQTCGNQGGLCVNSVSKSADGQICTGKYLTSSDCPTDYPYCINECKSTEESPTSCKNQGGVCADAYSKN
jgi:hypothetical protein